MSTEDQNSLRNLALKSFENEVRLKQYYGIPALEMPALILARLLIINSETNPELKAKINDDILFFVSNAGTPKTSVWYSVYNLTKESF